MPGAADDPQRPVRDLPRRASARPTPAPTVIPPSCCTSTSTRRTSTPTRSRLAGPACRSGRRRCCASTWPSPPARQPELATACSPATSPGFPNGRRLTDDVVDIAVQAVEGAAQTGQLVAGLRARSTRSTATIATFGATFPYLALPHVDSVNLGTERSPRAPEFVSVNPSAILETRTDQPAARSATPAPSRPPVRSSSSR